MRTLRATIVALGMVLAGSANAQFCPGAAPYVFTDVPSNDAFCGFITWAAQAGITAGCRVIDANNREYCPNDFVTRKQMAAFVARGFQGPANAAVTQVATGAGLTGGPITSTGTIGLAGTQLLPTVPCGVDEIAKWNGSAWVCATPAVPVVVPLNGPAINISTAAGNYPLAPPQPVTLASTNQKLVASASVPIAWDISSATGFAFGCIGGTHPSDPGSVYCIGTNEGGGSRQYTVGPNSPMVTLNAGGTLPYPGTWMIAPYMFKGATGVALHTYGTNGWVMVMP